MSNYYCKYISEENKDEWEELVANNIAGGFHQSFAWAKFKQLDGWDTYKIGLWNNDNKLIGGAILYEFTFKNASNFFYIPEGPIIPYKEDKHVLGDILMKEIIKTTDKATTHLRVEPRIETFPKVIFDDFEKAPINLQPRYTQIINLEKDVEDIKKEMKSKCRYNIKVAEKHNIEVSIENMSQDNLKRFYALYKETFTRSNFEGKKFQLFENLANSCKHIAKLYFAKKDGQDLAAAIIIYFADRSTYLYGGSSNQGRKYMPTYLLHWKIMEDAKINRFKEYDMWGVAPASSKENHSWKGISEFKMKFGGEQKVFIGAFDYVLQEEAYRLFLQKHEI